MPEGWGQPALLQEPQRSQLGDIDHERITGLALAQERDDAVGARRCAFHDALVTADEQRVVSHAADTTVGV